MNKKRLEKLCQINSVSSNEFDLKQYVQSLYPNYQYIEDRLGSVFIKKESKNKAAKTVLLACAGDEVGLMLSKDNGDGSYDFICLEPLSAASLLHQTVTIIKKDDTQATGIIIHKHNKFNEQALQSVEIKDLALRCFDTDVHPGDLVGLKNNYQELDGVVISKSLNQKASLEVILSVFDQLQDVELDFHLCAGFIAQSTIGFRGSKTATFVTEPDLALVVTGFEVSASKPSIELEDGLIVGQYDKQMLPNRAFIEDVKIKLDAKDYFGMKGNDGSFIHKTLKGTPTLSLGFPILNCDTAVETVCLSSLEIVTKQLTHYLTQLNTEDMKRFGVIYED